MWSNCLVDLEIKIAEYGYPANGLLECLEIRKVGSLAFGSKSN